MDGGSISSRLRVRSGVTSFQKGLERLKRKKQQRSLEELETLRDAALKDADARSDIVSPDIKFYDMSHSTSDSESARPESNSDSDTDFIVNDDEYPAVILPKEFTMRPEREREAFMESQMRDEQYFSVPIIMTRRRVEGLRDFLVASSTWRSNFKRLLNRYPTFERSSLASLFSSCDACRISSRMSTVCGSLSGTPYRHNGFGVSSETSNSGLEWTNNEHRQRKVEFHLGKLCANRTETYHRLTHWEYTLFQRVVSKIEALRVSGDDGERTRPVNFSEPYISPRTLRIFEDPDDMCQWMDEHNVINEEWDKLESLMDSARNLDVDSGKDANELGLDDGD
ncbi:hypothetical protein C8J56DRAFT_1068160 [Mycena floridula]|nr:hypothetical protein C8J56DRAFT_1068160 [Mycena floridula]